MKAWAISMGIETKTHEKQVEADARLPTLDPYWRSDSLLDGKSWQWSARLTQVHGGTEPLQSRVLDLIRV